MERETVTKTGTQGLDPQNWTPRLSMWEIDLMNNICDLRSRREEVSIEISPKAHGESVCEDKFWTVLTDASVLPRQAQGGLGAVVLDSSGLWSLETARRAEYPTRDTRLAELWAIELGVALVKEKLGADFAQHSLLLLCDCQPAVEALQRAQQSASLQEAISVDDVQSAVLHSILREGGAAENVDQVVRRIVKEMEAFETWKVSWVPREKLARSNELARQSLGLRPENKVMASWTERSWSVQKQMQAWEKRRKKQEGHAIHQEKESDDARKEERKRMDARRSMRYR